MPFQNKSDLVRDRRAKCTGSKKKLAEMKIPILAEETGENFGRTVIFYPETGDYVIRTAGRPEHVI